MKSKSVYQLFIFIPIIVLSLGSCTSISEDTYIISHHDNPTQINREGKFYYSSFNFILDSSDRLFFHNKDSLMNCCDTGADPNYPDYIALQPADMRLYSDGNFASLIDSVDGLPHKAKYSIQIAALVDTVHSKRFFKLLRMLRQRNFTNYAVRLATEEEREVLNAKIQNRPYNFYKVRWTSRFSHTLFPPPNPDLVK